MLYNSKKRNRYQESKERKPKKEVIYCNIIFLNQDLDSLDFKGLFPASFRVNVTFCQFLNLCSEKSYVLKLCISCPKLSKSCETDP